MYPTVVLGTFGNTKYSDLLRVVEAALEFGITSFDTAPSYGTEKMLGHVLCHSMKTHNLCREKLFVIDKVDAWQMQETRGNVRGFVEDAINMMGVLYLDVLFIHWPIDEYLKNTWESMNQLKAEGLVKDIGICNVRKRHLIQWKEMGIYPQNIQIERHPLRTCQDEMLYCRDNGIRVYSYSPLCRMHPKLKNSQVLLDLARKYNKNVGQVILRWHLDSGTTPVFMSTNPDRISQNIDIFDFSLNRDEIKSIDQLNCNYKIYLESWGCPGF